MFIYTYNNVTIYVCVPIFVNYIQRKYEKLVVCVKYTLTIFLGQYFYTMEIFIVILIIYLFLFAENSENHPVVQLLLDNLL